MKLMKLSQFCHTSQSQKKYPSKKMSIFNDLLVGPVGLEPTTKGL